MVSLNSLGLWGLINMGSVLVITSETRFGKVAMGIHQNPSRRMVKAGRVRECEGEREVKLEDSK
jgi:hypothetical protein